MLSEAPAQRDPRESQGGDPHTTLNGRFDGALKRERNSSTNNPSKSAGRRTAVSCGVTDIFTITAIESAAWRESRHIAAAARASADAGVLDPVLVAQPTATKSAEMLDNERRSTSAICWRRIA